ncbi:MAG: TonB family protein [Terriglobales bacterium]
MIPFFSAYSATSAVKCGRGCRWRAWRRCCSASRSSRFLPREPSLSSTPVARSFGPKNPDYPAVLKRKGIGGTVRLRARVLANGTVANIDVLGGDAALAESAAKAVMTWKYAPAASPSNEIVTINFSAR